MSASRSFKQPCGFTLVELLVSLVIVTILASLALAGLVAARARGRVAKTRSTIRKISEIILPYYELYEVRRPQLPASATQLDNRSQLAELRRIALRRLMALELPERVTDVTNNFTTVDPEKPPRSKPLVVRSAVDCVLSEVPPVARRYNSALAGKSGVTSADLLHLIVFRGPVADPDVIEHFRLDEIRDTNSNGMPEFVDGWNNPIKFMRWPVGFQSPTQPIDGKLSSVEERVCWGGHRLVPLIYSAGIDAEDDINDMALNYYAQNFNPFNSSVVENADEVPLGRDGEVAIYPVRRSSSITTYVAVPFGDPLPDGPGQIEPGATLVNMPHLTIGSRKGPGARDNIHNHDMTR